MSKPSIVAVVEHYGGAVIGGDRGGWRKARCPMHDDRNPSASVNEDTERFHCHSCDFDGDGYDLIQRVENVGFIDAKRLGAEQFGASGADVQRERGSGGLLPRKSRNHRAGSSWVPPWGSIR